MNIDSREQHLEKLVVGFILVILLMSTAITGSNHNIRNVVKAQGETTVALSELKGQYKKLNDELWEVKQAKIRLDNRIKTLESELIKLNKVKEEQVIIDTPKNTTQEKTQETTKETKGELHTITCYDLSEDSNGTWKGHKWYGLTASGFDLRGHTWESARTVAVDKRLYPFGTKLKLTFVGEKYQKYNGIYTARDTGGLIKGKKLDLFLGDFNQRRTHQSVWDFGKTTAYVEVVK